MIPSFVTPLLLAANISGQYPTINNQPIFCYMEDFSGRVIPLNICQRDQQQKETSAQATSTVVDALNFSAAEKDDNKTYYDRRFCEFKADNILLYENLATTYTISYMQGKYGGRVSKEDFSALSAGIERYIATELAIPEPVCD